MSLEIYKTTVLEKYPEACMVSYEDDGETYYRVITSQHVPKELGEGPNEVHAWADAYLKVLREPVEKSTEKLDNFMVYLRGLCEDWNVTIFGDWGESVIVEDKDEPECYLKLDGIN